MIRDWDGGSMMKSSLNCIYLATVRLLCAYCTTVAVLRRRRAEAKCELCSFDPLTTFAFLICHGDKINVLVRKPKSV